MSHLSGQRPTGQLEPAREVPNKPRLPKLQGIINKKAQQIIADHMHHSMTQSSLSSTATVPVLMQIDSTAPRTSRTHDISHLLDRPAFLNPRIPPSLIEDSDHIFETSFLPKDSSSVYREDDGLWHTKVFPSSTPSSRTDAIMLDAWITRSLEQYRKEGPGAGNEDLARAVEDLVPILSVALHEIVRQVTHHCTERGTVLEKIWRTYVELFDRVLKEMQSSLLAEKKKTAEFQQILMGTKASLERHKRSHPEQMQSVIARLEAEFTTRQQQVEEELQQCEEENMRLKVELRTHHQELEIWYPSFPLYQDSYIKNHIPHYSQKAGSHGGPLGRHADRTPSNKLKSSVTGEGGAEDEDIPPEVAIAEDFKRLLAVLAPDKRKGIGKELAVVLKTSSVAPGGKQKKEQKMRLSQIARVDQAQAAEEAEINRLQSEVNAQEERIRELKEEISVLEKEEEEQNHITVPEPQLSVGKDQDGQDLMHRRGTAAPQAVMLQLPKAGRKKLAVPG
mmetsp:Transcript_126852/g.237079  ORF Transcript_126852/g.237079 Transcript_126852/m.237079 type:complete len:506 (-) Transcript_126852:57-1574(-)